VWCGVACFFLSDLRLCLGGPDPLGHGAATPPAGLYGRGRLPPSSSSSFGGAASLGWGRSTLSHAGFASASTATLFLLHLPVSVDSLEVKPPQIPFAFILGFPVALF
jgi:hypothetical protein